MLIQPDIKMICCDMDGTLLNSEGKITEEIATAINLLLEKNIIFTITSGRMPHRINKHVGSVIANGNRNYVANNGATIICNGRLIQNKTFPVRPYRNVIIDYLGKGLEIDFDFNDSYHPLIKTERTQRESSHFKGYNEPLGVEEKVWNLSVNKISVYNSKGKDIFTNFIDEMESIGNCTIYPYGNAAEIVPLHCSKMTGIELISKTLNIKPSEILSIGDHMNDIEMLSKSRYSAAVGNAVEEAKKAAKYVCSQPYEKGVLEALIFFKILRSRNEET